MHASDEQLEAVLQGWAQDKPVCTCEDCRCRLERMRQVRGRVQKAFACTCASDDLKDRVRSALQTQKHGQDMAALRGPQGGEQRRAANNGHGARKLLAAHPLVRRLAPVLMAAAAVLIVAVPLAIMFTSSPEAQAAPPAAKELIGIHAANLTESHDGHGFVASDDPAALAEHFRNQLGFVPAMPKLDQGLKMRGCCVAHFQGKAVGSYVVNTPKGPISIIVVPETPQAMRFCDKRQQDGQTYYTCAFEHNRLAMVRLGDYTYCAVGQIDHQHLIDLLDKLVR